MSFFRFSFRRLVLLIILAGFLAAAMPALWLCDQMRDAMSQRLYTDPGDNPRIVLITHVLGGFRGLLIDAVWLRAVKLQQSNKFWELYQLYTWMGQLEPRLEEIWDFNGWNMAYNLVAELQDSEARWQWIQRSIEWLRDEGLKYNPRSGKIKERISWIYFQKIGRDLDLHHYYYKHRWALIMHALLGDRDEQDVAAWRDAPKTLEELFADSAVLAALGKFQLNPPDEKIKTLDTAESRRTVHPEVVQALAGEKAAGARKKVYAYLAARVLRSKYKITNLEIPVEMEKLWGRFDWRLPEPHAIYWSTDALRPDQTLKQQINYDRIILYSLQETMRRGNIGYLGGDPRVPMLTVFDLSKIGPLDRAYEMLLMKYQVTRDDYGAASVRDGHVQFLQEATRQLYFSGYYDEALKYHKRLKDLYDKPQPYVSMEEYVIGQVKKGIDENWTRAKARAFVDGMVFQTCLLLCLNKFDEARKHETIARLAWEAYVEYAVAQEQGRLKGAAPNAGHESFADIERDVVRSILSGRNPSFPKPLIEVLRKILKVPPGAEIEKLAVDEVIVPRIPPSSPTPK
jgi:hypothetical protein